MDGSHSWVRLVRVPIVGCRALGNHRERVSEEVGGKRRDWQVKTHDVSKSSYPSDTKS